LSAYAWAILSPVRGGDGKVEVMPEDLGLPSFYVAPEECVAISCGDASIMLKPDGDIYVNGRLTTTDKEVVDGMVALLRAQASVAQKRIGVLEAELSEAMRVRRKAIQILVAVADEKQKDGWAKEAANRFLIEEGES
jgi:hypothetical protein